MSVPGEAPSEAVARFKDRRFGLFVHFGLYSLAARGEWMRHGERTSDADYQQYFDHFDPDLFDPQEWAAQAQAAGMQYVVVTTKHHEGFCLWDSELYRLHGRPHAVRPRPAAARWSTRCASAASASASTTR